MREEEKKLRQEEKEQLQLLSTEIKHNNDLENHLKTCDNIAMKLRNNVKDALAQEEDLNSQVYIFLSS